uniref:SEC63 domain-containing protein n=1 Tax=Meloidogyne enterolobii TaxID=390850 RepID=A0A6V7XR70_MELEN|nr:unnamed protein product [Meloidogyne enterolobii]
MKKFLLDIMKTKLIEIQTFLPIKLDVSNWESSHVKTHLLYQAHFSRMHLPVDYITDQRSIIESCIRILQAMFDFCVEMHLLNTTLNVLILQQQIFQARWYTDHPLLCLPHLSAHSIDGIGPLFSIPQIKERLGIYQLNNGQKLTKKEEKRIITEFCSKSILSEKEADELLKALLQWPILSLEQIYLLPQQKKQRQKFEEKLIINVGMNGKNLELSASTNYKFFVSLKLCQFKCFLPKFPKKRTAGWILLLGDATTNRLWGHERIPSLIEEQKIARLRILTPNEPGIYQLLLLVISDTYLGIDQQYILNFKVV